MRTGINYPSFDLFQFPEQVHSLMSLWLKDNAGVYLKTLLLLPSGDFVL